MASEKNEGGATREAIKTHFEYCRHITTLGAAVAIVLFAVGREFDPLLEVSVAGLVTIAICLMVGTSNMLISAYFLGYRQISRLTYGFIVFLSMVTGSMLAAAIATTILTVVAQYGTKS